MTRLLLIPTGVLLFTGCFYSEEVFPVIVGPGLNPEISWEPGSGSVLMVDDDTMRATDLEWCNGTAPFEVRSTSLDRGEANPIPSPYRLGDPVDGAQRYACAEELGDGFTLIAGHTYTVSISQRTNNGNDPASYGITTWVAEE